MKINNTKIKKITSIALSMMAAIGLTTALVTPVIMTNNYTPATHQTSNSIQTIPSLKLTTNLDETLKTLTMEVEATNIDPDGDIQITLSDDDYYSPYHNDDHYPTPIDVTLTLDDATFTPAVETPVTPETTTTPLASGTYVWDFSAVYASVNISGSDWYDDDYDYKNGCSANISVNVIATDTSAVPLTSDDILIQDVSESDKADLSFELDQDGIIGGTVDNIDSQLVAPPTNILVTGGSAVGTVKITYDFSYPSDYVYGTDFVIKVEMSSSTSPNTWVELDSSQITFSSNYETIVISGFTDEELTSGLYFKVTAEFTNIVIDTFSPVDSISQGPTTPTHNQPTDPTNPTNPNDDFSFNDEEIVAIIVGSIAFAILLFAGIGGIVIYKKKKARARMINVEHEVTQEDLDDAEIDETDFEDSDFDAFDDLDDFSDPKQDSTNEPQNSNTFKSNDNDKDITISVNSDDDTIVIDLDS